MAVAAVVGVDLSGIRTVDQVRATELWEAAFDFSAQHLVAGGAFACKVRRQWHGMCAARRRDVYFASRHEHGPPTPRSRIDKSGSRRINTGAVRTRQVFQSDETEHLRRKMRQAFDAVRLFKPKSSRSESAETYLVGVGFRGTLLATARSDSG